MVQTSKGQRIQRSPDRQGIAGPGAACAAGQRHTAAPSSHRGAILQGLHWLSITDEHWHQATQLAYSLRRKGVTASAIDALIASVVTAYRCSLLHYDRDYAFIAKYSSGLKLYRL